MESVRASISTALADRYSIERELGSGATAFVFLARDLKHDRWVAIKVLKPDVATAVGAERFHREIEVAAGLTHPHILSLHDSGEAAGLLYFVMPYVEGESLRERLARNGRLPVPDALRITREIADALGFAHRHGVIHRDVKPANILLAEDHALLADFGIAHLVRTAEGTLTGPGLALGTPHYFSPEQATADRDLDGRSDIYSLGCVLYEALTAEPPFTAPHVRAVITKHLVEDPPLVKASRPEVSDGVEAVVQTALQKDPDRRFQTAEEMAGSVDLVSGGFEVLVSAALRRLLGPRYRWLHGVRLAGLVVAAIALLAIGGFLFRYARVNMATAEPYPVYAIFPYEGAELSPAELALANEGARDLYLDLQGWESMSVVNGQSIEGQTTRLVQAGFAMPTRSVEAGLEFADRIAATHVIWVDARLRDDSVTLIARVHLSTEERPHQTFTQLAPWDDVDLAAAGLAMQVLDIHGEPAQIGQFRRRSSSPGAHQQHRQGLSALLDWRLAEAEQHFREAIKLDSVFAPAHFQLAFTMYWRTVRDPERILDGETIHYHVAQADRFGDEEKLRPGERRSLNAFKAFWSGNYEAARSQYEAILRRDPTRIDALVLAGAIEYEDPWAASDTAGNPVGPRGDWNRAIAFFDSAVALNSHVQLAWGRLFEIARDVAHTAFAGTCYGYLPPGGPLIPPYEFPEAAEVDFYCPYFDNGILVWLPDTLTSAQRKQAKAGIEELQSGLLGRLEFWERVERYQPRPHEELADWLVWERSARGCETDPARAAALLGEARAHMERALEIRGDTTPEDRMRLGALWLATGDVGSAKAQTDRAIEDLGDWHDRSRPPPPKLAGNVYLAIGQGHPTAEILEAVSNLSTWSIPDSTAEGGHIPGGPVWGTLMAIEALGLTGDDDPGLTSRFATVHRTWAEMGYTERQQALLRAHTTSIVAPALLRQPVQWRTWFGNWELHGRPIPPAWQALFTLDDRPEDARAHLREAIRQVEALPAERRRAVHYYMPIRLAERLEDDSTAEELSARAAACPLELDNIDFGWGMTRYLTAAR